MLNRRMVHSGSMLHFWWSGPCDDLRDVDTHGEFLPWLREGDSLLDILDKNPRTQVVLHDILVDSFNSKSLFDARMLAASWLLVQLPLL